jgi:hypothetical protein
MYFASADLWGLAILALRRINGLRRINNVVGSIPTAPTNHSNLLGMA